MPPSTRTLSRLRSVDFYKKIPADLTEATLTGAGLSIAAALIMSTLVVLVRGRVLLTAWALVVWCDVLLRGAGGLNWFRSWAWRRLADEVIKNSSSGKQA